MAHSLRMFSGKQPRGLSNLATIVIAALLVLVGWRFVMGLVGAVVGLLAIAIQIAVMVLVFMLIVYAIRAVGKKASE